MIPINDLTRLSDNQIAQISNELDNVLKSGGYILGGYVAEFEREFGKILGGANVIAVGSGTDALVLAMRALEISAGDKVATQANAGGYSTIAAHLNGAQSIFVDVNDNGAMDPQDLETKLRNHPDIKAVVITHLFGLIGEVVEIAKICRDAGVFLIEDCAQAVGAELSGRSAGTFGEISTFSFYPTKNLGALGDAGAVATNSSAIAKKLFSLRQYGWDQRYVVKLPFGQNSRMDEFQAAILLHRLPDLKTISQTRRAIWSRYKDALRNSPWRLIGRNEESFVAHLGVLVAPEGKRAATQEFLESMGVSTSIHYPVLDYLQPAWKSMYSANCPGSENLVSRILTIPLFPQLRIEEIERVEQALGSLQSEVR